MTFKKEPLCPMRHALSFAASDICTQFSVIRYLSSVFRPLSSVLCPLLFCNQLIAILNIGISQHHIGINRGFLKRLVLSNSHGDVIDRLTGANG